MPVSLRRTAFSLTPLFACAFSVMPAIVRAQGVEPAPAQAVAAPISKSIDGSARSSAERSYQHGAQQMREFHYEAAAREFAEAVRLDPTRPEYYQALTLARESRVTGLLQTAAQQQTKNPVAAERLLAEARGIDPTNPRVLQHDAANTTLQNRDVTARQRFVPAGAIELQPNHAVHSFHEMTDARALAAEIGASYGLRVAVDPDLQSKQLRVDLDNANYDTAIRVFNMLAGTFVTPLDEHTMLVAEDTTANRNRLEHLLEEVIPLPGFSVEQINETATLVRTVFELKQVSVATQAGAIAIRAPKDTMDAIDTILADLLDSGNEVTVDVKLYSVNAEKVRNLGIVLPTSFTLFSVGSEVQNVIANNSSLIQELIADGVLASTASPATIAAYLVFVAGLGSSTNLQNTFFIFGGGLNSLTSGTSGLSITPIGIAASSFPALNFALTNSDARELDDLELRIADRATGIFKAGIRYPIQTSIYSDVASSTTSSGTLAALIAKYLGTSSSSLTSSVIPQFQYEDLGMTVTATPRVTSNNEVSLKIEIKLSALSGTSINGIPVLASRQFSSTLTLEDGQTAVMASHVQDNEAAVVTGVPGLTDLPGLSNLTNRSTDKARTNLVLMLTPHIVRRTHEAAHGPYVPLPPRPDDD